MEGAVHRFAFSEEEDVHQIRGVIAAPVRPLLWKPSENLLGPGHPYCRERCKRENGVRGLGISALPKSRRSTSVPAGNKFHNPGTGRFANTGKPTSGSSHSSGNAYKATLEETFAGG